MSEAKINIKVGHVEFSGEGEQDWLSQQLRKILAKVPEVLHMEISIHKNAREDKKDSNAQSADLSLSMVSIGAKLKPKTGPELALAAAAYLRFVKKKATFRREDILNSMKEATGYYKANYSNNLSSTLLGLVKSDSLTQAADNAFSLHIDKENEINAILAR